MKYVSTVARVLLGLMFLILGLNVIFLFFGPPSASVFPKYALEWNNAMYASHYVYLTGTSQAVAGLLVLINRFTGFALIVLGAILANILTFHITMWPQTLFPMPIVALALWVLTCWPLRHEFARVFAARIPPYGTPRTTGAPATSGA